MRTVAWSAAVVLVVGMSSAAAEEAAPPADVFVAAEAEAGPEPTLRTACATEDATCKARKLKHKPKLAAPYRGLGLIERRDHQARQELLGIQTDAGWYVFELLSWGTAYGGRGSLTIRSIELRDAVPGGAPEVIVAGKRTWSNESSSYTVYGATEELLWVCGVGASKAPSCAEVPIAVDSTPSDMDEVATAYRFRLVPTWGADGTLTRTVKGRWPKGAVTSFDGPLERAAYENTRGFVFP